MRTGNRALKLYCALDPRDLDLLEQAMARLGLWLEVPGILRWPGLLPTWPSLIVSGPVHLAEAIQY